MAEINLPKIEGVEFRVIPGFERYAVGTDGSVWSLAKKKTWQKRKLGKRPNGYLGVDLYMPGKVRIALIHRLVLEIFVGPCPHDMEACHNNGDRKDNRLENLRWDSHSANCGQDRRKHGTALLGEKNHRARLTAEDVKKIREMKQKGLSGNRISKMLGFNKQAVLHVISGKTWGHL